MTEGKRVRLLVGSRRDGETDWAVQTCNDWLRLGPGRNLESVSVLNKSKQESTKQPTIGTVEQWSNKFKWVERSAIYDARYTETKKTEARSRVMNAGLALDYERVNHLKEYAELLHGQITKTDKYGKYINLWGKDIKGNDIFHHQLIVQARGTLDDLAKETGGRQSNEQRIAKIVNRLIFERKLSPEQIKLISEGEDPIDVIAQQ